MSNLSLKVWSRLAIVLLCILNAGHLSAQQPKIGQLSGHVVDVVGATIKRASVFVRRNVPSEENIRLLAHTDINGNFTLELPEGGYDILVTSPGFVAAVQTLPVLAARTKKTQWKLKALDCNFPDMNCDTVQ